MKLSLYLIGLLILCGFTPIFNDYKDPQNVKNEVANIENSLQDQQHRVLVSTPNLLDLKDGEIVLVSSNTFNKIMYRQNQEIYAVNASCVTIRR